MEYFLNGAELSLNSLNAVNSGNQINQWSMNWDQLTHGSCQRCGSILVSNTRGGWVVVSSTFTVMKNIYKYIRWIHWNIYGNLHYPATFLFYASTLPNVQGLFVPFALVGSVDPVRVLHLFHDEYTGWSWSIYCWDLVPLVTTKSNVLLYLLPTSVWLYCWASSAGLTGNDSELMLSILYCTVP